MKKLLFLFIIGFSLTSLGQDKSSKVLLDEGNQAFISENYEEAIEKYQEAKSNSSYFKADYNKANSLYKQDKFEEATNEYEQIVNKAETKLKKQVPITILEIATYLRKNTKKPLELIRTP